ncbi:ribosomal protein S18-alanine N-acetyltransferase [Actinoalloteichus caeruleus]|uniref:ribosomal protein S18-alanine N-acetyltransferase n=1 Tax=Actinoalloteichus cyanogriseus TaxID=2893586 RepID=UPI0004AAEDD2|nr:ribosomal protein S18-alanine N-acetyltransferase [Actinoalloteichus caeruleus]
MTVAIRRLRRIDAGRCAELERELFPGDDPWSERAFLAEMAAGHRYVGAYAAPQEPADAGEAGRAAGPWRPVDTEGPLVGYGGLAVLGRSPDLEAEVHTIAVDPAWQGRGVGTALLRSLLAHADSLRAPTFLEVRTDNDSAIRLYERHGFVRVGLRRRYYQPSGADAYTMRRGPAEVAAPTGGPERDEGEPR